MKEKPEFADEIEAKIRETFAMKDAPEEETPDKKPEKKSESDGFDLGKIEL